jgi:hypothetical protein
LALRRAEFFIYTLARADGWRALRLIKQAHSLKIMEIPQLVDTIYGRC